jgi:hypothetical protein
MLTSITLSIFARQGGATSIMQGVKPAPAPTQNAPKK